MTLTGTLRLAPLALIAAVVAMTAALDRPETTIAVADTPSCSPAQTATALERLMTGPRRESVEAVAARLGGQADTGYSIGFAGGAGGPGAFAGRDPRRFAEHLVARAAKGERLRLLIVEVSVDTRRGLVHASLRYRRTAPDFPRRRGHRNRIGVGKAAVRCDTGRVPVLNVALDPTGRRVPVGDLCGRDARHGNHARRPIVCER